jgi:hypothetical protein
MQVSNAGFEGFQPSQKKELPLVGAFEGRVYVVIDDTGTIATTMDRARGASAKKIQSVLQERGTLLSSEELQLIFEHSKGFLLEKRAKDVTASSVSEGGQGPEILAHNIVTARHLRDQAELLNLQSHIQEIDPAEKSSQKFIVLENAARNLENFLTLDPPLGDPVLELSYSRALFTLLDFISDSLCAFRDTACKKRSFDALHQIRAGWHQVADSLIGSHASISSPISEEPKVSSDLVAALKRLRVQSYNVDFRDAHSYQGTLEFLRGSLRFLGDLVLLRTAQQSAFFDECVKSVAKEFQAKLETIQLPSVWDSWKAQVMEAVSSLEIS